MKKFFLTVACILFAVPVFAQIQPKDFSLGFHVSGSMPLGDFRDFSAAGVGGGLDVEYIVDDKIQPFPDKFKFGFSFDTAYKYSFIKEGKPISALHDISTELGFFMRLPIVDKGKFKLAFSPELGYGLVFHVPVAVDGAELKGLYVNQMLSVSPSFRFILPKDLEINVAPMYRIAFEPSDTQHEVALKLGLMWHISDFLADRRKTSTSPAPVSIEE